MIACMAYWYKIGLLVLNDDKTKFLVCEKAEGDITTDYIMPGGQMEEETLEENLKREIREELDCDVDFDSLKYIGEYADVAAGMPDREIVIELYQGRLIGRPKPSSEVKYLHWIGKEDAANPRVSPIIRNQIIPSLVEKGILR
jgi:8-oxo-dGTP pyrophosphatase MutT (NUDIX family)